MVQLPDLKTTVADVLIRKLLTHLQHIYLCRNVYFSQEYVNFCTVHIVLYDKFGFSCIVRVFHHLVYSLGLPLIPEVNTIINPKAILRVLLVI